MSKGTSVIAVFKARSTEEAEHFIGNFNWYAVFKFIHQIYSIFHAALEEKMSLELSEFEAISRKLFSICSSVMLGSCEASVFEQSIVADLGAKCLNEIAGFDKILATFAKFLQTTWSSCNSSLLLNMHLAHASSQPLKRLKYKQDCLQYLGSSDRIFEMDFIRKQKDGSLVLHVKFCRVDVFDKMRTNLKEKFEMEREVFEYSTFSDRNNFTDSSNSTRAVFLRRNIRNSSLPPAADCVVENGQRFYFNRKRKLTECLNSNSAFFVRGAKCARKETTSIKRRDKFLAWLSKA